jgi:acetyl esterase/lipase
MAKGFAPDISYQLDILAVAALIFWIAAFSSFHLSNFHEANAAILKHHLCAASGVFVISRVVYLKLVNPSRLSPNMQPTICFIARSLQWLLFTVFGLNSIHPCVFIPALGGPALILSELLTRSTVRTSPHNKYYTSKLIPIEESNESKRVIFYIHGGGFCSHTATEKFIASNVFQCGLKCRFYPASYTLAPHASLKEVRADLMEQYDKVVSQNPGSSIVISGDSAGGNLALMLCVELSEQYHTTKVQPNGMVLFSPWLDVDGEAALESSRTNRSTDMMAHSFIRAFHSVMLRSGIEIEAMSEILNRVNLEASKGTLPQMMIVAGGGELFADEAKALYIAAQSDNVGDDYDTDDQDQDGEEGNGYSAEIYLGNNSPHDFILLEGLNFEGKAGHQETWRAVNFAFARFFEVDESELTMIGGADMEDGLNEEDEFELGEFDEDEVDAFIVNTLESEDLVYRSASEYCERVIVKRGSKVVVSPKKATKSAATTPKVGKASAKKVTPKVAAAVAAAPKTPRTASARKKAAAAVVPEVQTPSSPSKEVAKRRALEYKARLQAAKKAKADGADAGGEETAATTSGRRSRTPKK